MANFIKRLFQSRSLKAVQKAKRSEFVPLNRAKSLAIVFNNENNELEEVLNYIKNSPAFAGCKCHYYTYNKEDINWYGKPLPLYIKELSQYSYDITIDISDGRDYSINYILSSISSKFTIGSSYTQKNFCDMIIAKSIDNLENDSEYSSAEQIHRIQSIIQYLQTIQS